MSISVRKTQTAVNVTAFCGDKVLMMRRGKWKTIDPNKVNNIWWKVEKYENVLQAAVREFNEETPYTITLQDLVYTWYGRLVWWYSKDWIMTFFNVYFDEQSIDYWWVDWFEIDGDSEWELFWIWYDKVLELDCVDDVKYIWSHICNKNELFFFDAHMNDDLTVRDISLDISNVVR